MSLGSARSGKELDYDALSLVRDNDPAEVGDLWQQAALRLTEDEESAGRASDTFFQFILLCKLAKGC